jgi:hypothetical protein
MFMNESCPFLSQEDFRGKDTSHKGLQPSNLVFTALLKHGVALSLVLVLSNLHTHESYIYIF